MLYLSRCIPKCLLYCYQKESFLPPFIYMRWSYLLVWNFSSWISNAKTLLIHLHGTPSILTLLYLPRNYISYLLYSCQFLSRSSLFMKLPTSRCMHMICLFLRKMHIVITCIFHRGLAHAQYTKFPEGFTFGVATAAHQIEGAWNVSGKEPFIFSSTYIRFTFIIPTVTNHTTEHFTT